MNSYEPGMGNCVISPAYAPLKPPRPGALPLRRQKLLSGHDSIERGIARFFSKSAGLLLTRPFLGSFVPIKHPLSMNAVTVALDDSVSKSATVTHTSVTVQRSSTTQAKACASMGRVNDTILRVSSNNGLKRRRSIHRGISAMKRESACGSHAPLKNPKFPKCATFT